MGVAADAAMVAFTVGFIWGGWWTGFLRRLLGLLFIGISFVLTAYLRAPFGTFIHSIAKDVTPAYAELWAALLLFPVTLIVLHVVTGRLVKNVAVRGVSRGLDKVLGAVFGFIEAVLILSVVVIAVDLYAATPGAAELNAARPLHEVIIAISNSNTAKLLRDTTIPVLLSLFGPLLPKDLSSLLPKLPSLPGLPSSGIPGIPGFPSSNP